MASRIPKPLKRVLRSAADHLPSPLFLYVRHCIRFRKLGTPWRARSFNDHLLRLMLDGSDRRRRLFGDKLATRAYVEQCLGPGYLPALYQQVDDPDAMDFAALPDKFILKASHGSNMNQIVLDKAQLDIGAFREKARDWLATDYGRRSHEWVYRNPAPRLFAEELLQTESGLCPFDYKLFCFHGRAAMIQVIRDRSVTDQMSRHHVFYDTDWQRLDLSWGTPPGADVARPAHLDAMRQVAHALSREFDFLRVDMFLLGDRIVIGELTNFPEAGNRRILPVSQDYWLGSHFRGAR